MSRAFVTPAFVLLPLLLLPPAAASAQPFETVGARALGMGGAFVGVADDVTAIWWNPAGLASGPLFSAAIERNRFEQQREGLFAAPHDADRSSFFVGAGSLPLGLSYARTRETFMAEGPADEAFTRDLITHQAGLTLLQSLSDAIVVSATLKYVRGTAASAPVGEPAEGRGSQAFDADVALMAQAGGVKAGVTVRNVTSPEFEAEDGTRLELPWRARAGVSYAASEALTLAADVDLRAIRVQADRRRALAFGAEWRGAAPTRFAVRAGARFDTIGEANPLGTVGASYAVRNGVWLDVWAADGARGAERGWGVAGRVVY